MDIETTARKILDGEIDATFRREDVGEKLVELVDYKSIKNLLKFLLTDVLDQDIQVSIVKGAAKKSPEFKAAMLREPLIMDWMSKNRSAFGIEE